VTHPLHQVLEKLRHQGAFDSSGQFTLDLAKAQRGTAVFSHPQSYLLLLIQCAYASGAKRLDLYSKGQRLEAFFSSPGFDPIALHNKKELCLVRSGRTPVDFLTAAVRAAAQFEPEAVYWGCCSPEFGWGLRLKDQQTCEQRLSGTTSGANECFFAVDWKARGKLWSGSSPRLREIDKIQRMATFCPFPIYFNGKSWPRSLETGAASGSGAFPWLCDRIYLLDRYDPSGLTLPHNLTFPARVYDLGDRDWKAVKETPARTYLQQWRGYDGYPRPDLPLFPKFGFDPMKLSHAENLAQIRATDLPLSQGTSLLWTGAGGVHFVTAPPVQFSAFEHPLVKGISRPSLCARAFLRVPSRPGKVESHLIWVQNGVCLEPVSVRLLMSDVTLILEDARQAVDLSGLKVVENERFLDVVEWVNGELLQMASDLRRALNHWKAQGIPKDWVIRVMTAQHLDIKD